MHMKSVSRTDLAYFQSAIGKPKDDHSASRPACSTNAIACPFGMRAALAIKMDHFLTVGQLDTHLLSVPIDYPKANMRRTFGRLSEHISTR